MSNPNLWVSDFVGIGYRYHDIYMNIFPLFLSKKEAFKLWKKTIEWWPDNKIKLRFVEDDQSYWFILYGGSEYSQDNTGFIKNMPISENYTRFKTGYEKKAILRFGVYKKTFDHNEYNLEILKKSKSVYDIIFLKYTQLAPDSIEAHCIKENKQ